MIDWIIANGGGKDARHELGRQRGARKAKPEIHRQLNLDYINRQYPCIANHHFQVRDAWVKAG